MTTFLAFLLSLIFAFFVGGFVVIGGIQKAAPELWPQLQKKVHAYAEERRKGR